MFWFWRRKPKKAMDETKRQGEPQPVDARQARIQDSISGTWPPKRPPEEALYQQRLKQKEQERAAALARQPAEALSDEMKGHGASPADCYGDYTSGINRGSRGKPSR